MSPSVPALRSSSSTPILSVAIVVSLRVVGCYSNDARMTRWPLVVLATCAVTPTLGTRPELPDLKVPEHPELHTGLMLL
jgi:hypothetical protein